MGVPPYSETVRTSTPSESSPPHAVARKTANPIVLRCIGFTGATVARGTHPGSGMRDNAPRRRSTPSTCFRLNRLFAPIPLGGADAGLRCDRGDLPGQSLLRLARHGRLHRHDLGQVPLDLDL